MQNNLRLLSLHNNIIFTNVAQPLSKKRGDQPQVSLRLQTFHAWSNGNVGSQQQLFPHLLFSSKHPPSSFSVGDAFFSWTQPNPNANGNSGKKGYHHGFKSVSFSNDIFDHNGMNSGDPPSSLSGIYSKEEQRNSFTNLMQ